MGRASIGRFAHFAAIDWSGAAGPRQAGIAVALCAAGRAAPVLVRPGHRWARAEVLRWLLDELPPDTLVGLDLGPALPFADRGAYFPGWDRSPPNARALWALVEAIAAKDPHLAARAFVDHPDIAPHFRRHGGRTGAAFGTGRGRLRVTEQVQLARGLSPSSSMNLVGAAQVGKASLTGMRLFHRLGHALPLWPIDPLPSAGSVLVEIYTTIAALAAGRPRGRSKMTTPDALDAALIHPAIGSDPARLTPPVDDHRTDAILTAAWLRTHADRADLWTPAALTPALARTEGWTFGVG